MLLRKIGEVHHWASPSCEGLTSWINKLISIWQFRVFFLVLKLLSRVIIPNSAACILQSRAQSVIPPNLYSVNVNEIVMHVGSITTFRLFQNNALAEIRAKNHSMVSTRVLPAMAHGLILWWCINPNRSTVDRYVTFHKFTTWKDARRVCPVDGLEINIWNTNRYCITR